MPGWPDFMSALTASFTSNPLVRLTAPLLAIALAFVPAGARAGRRLTDGDRIEIVAPRQGG